MNRAKLEAKLIRIKRTIALDLKAAAELEERARKRRTNAARLQKDGERLEREMAKAR